MSKKITIWHNGTKKLSFVITAEQSRNNNTMRADELIQSLVHISLCSGLSCVVDDLSIADHDNVIAHVRDEKKYKLAQLQNEQDKRQLEIQF